MPTLDQWIAYAECHAELCETCYEPPHITPEHGAHILRALDLLRQWKRTGVQPDVSTENAIVRRYITGAAKNRAQEHGGDKAIIGGKG